MERRDWKGTIRRIGTSLRQGRARTGIAGGQNKRHKSWALWSALSLAALIVAGVAVSATRNSSVAMQADRVLPGELTKVGGGPSQEGLNPPMLDSSIAIQQPIQPAGGGAVQQVQPWDRMIVRTATLQITVKDVGVSLDEARTIASARGGYVTQTDSRQDGDYTVATITIQVPTREFDGVISQLRKMGIKPVQENVTSSDVTEEYTDLQSQSRNLVATEERILALMSKAVLIDDVLTLDRELRQVRGEIERVQGRLNYLAKRAEMSTITVSLFPEAAPIAEVKPVDAWDPGQIALQAWNASLDMLAGVGRVAITASVFLWWAVPVLLAIWLITRPRRRTSAQGTPAGEAP